MYIPAHFAEAHPGALRAPIGANNFPTFVSSTGARPFAMQVPFLCAPAERALRGRKARADPHGQNPTNGDTGVLVTVQGSHACVSPAWYEQAGVPTLNAAAVHVHGACARVTEPPAQHRSLADLTERHDTANPEPCRADCDAPLGEHESDNARGAAALMRARQ